MFGVNDNTQQSNDDPAMLDNVKQLASQPADQVMPSTSPSQDTPAAQPAPVTAPAQGATPAPPTPEQTPPAPVGPPQPVATPAAGFSTGDNNEHPADETPQAATPEVNSAAPPAPITSPHQGDTAATNPADDTSVSADTTEKTDDSQAEQQTVDTPETTSEEPISPSAPVAPVVAPDANHLAGLKKQALEHLEPLSDHIDGTPEETFKTTMMMIQANDNHTLLEKALAAAQKIEDDKVRAQAMLDIINEINYFSQATGESPSGDSEEAN